MEMLGHEVGSARSGTGLLPALARWRRTLHGRSQCPPGFEDFDPYTCGDDLIIPRKEEDFDTAYKFMNKFAPPGMDDYEFVEVDDDDPAGCWTAKAFSSGTSILGSRGSLVTMACITLSAVLLRR